MIPQPPADLWSYIGEAALGLLAGLVYALYTIRKDLFDDREKEPTPRERAAAWWKFWNALIASPLFAGTFTTSLTRLGHGTVTWPAVAVFIGITVNMVWPVVAAGLSDGVKARVMVIVNAVFNGGAKS